MKDLQASRAEAVDMNSLQVRGLTKIKHLLEGFENDSDFIISNRDAAQSVMNSERGRTGTMMTNKTLNAQ